MKACDVELKGTYDGQIGIIADTLRENYFMIAMSILAVAAAGFLLWQLIGNIINIVTIYKRFTQRVDSTVQIQPISDKADDVVQMQIANILGEGDISASGDDYNPLPVTDEQDLQEPEEEGTAIRRKIAEIKGLYGSYNKEITKYSRDVQKEEPTDLMDQRILSKDNDTY